MARVVLAMSGGVDSSVAAHLLCEAGHDVVGVFMRHGQHSPVACGQQGAGSGEQGAESREQGAESREQGAESREQGAESREQGAGSGEQGVKNQLPILPAPGSVPPARGSVPPARGSVPPAPAFRLDHKQGCCTAADAEDARRVADRLAIAFYALNLNEEFARIIDYFVDEYTAGRTPNPCVQCNNWIKFGKLFDYADSIGAEFVATGHYARLQREASGEAALLRGRDAGKDQSYVLFGIQRPLLERMLLPVGDFQKTEIRRRAAALGLNVAQKKDSQEICFVTSGRYDEFVRAHRAEVGTAGELVTTAGTVVGRHDGIECFTVGQRKGLGVALGEPKFVVRIESDTRRVVLGDRDELAQDQLTAAETNWLVDPKDVPARCQVQIRYHSAPAAATVQLLPARRMRVVFDEPQFGVTPGQAAVCYDGPRTLGGGWIE